MAKNEKGQNRPVGKLTLICNANDYYTLVVEVSGSFNSYSASKETCKKELASALDDFSFELD